MKYVKPKIEKENEILPPITTNFAPPPAKGAFDNESNPNIKKKAEHEGTGESEHLRVLRKNSFD